MIPQQELTAQDIRETMQTIGQEHLSLEADGYIVTSEMLFDVLMKAASEGISIDAACRELEMSASANRIREYLNEQISPEELKSNEDEINEALGACLPGRMLKCKVEAAIDEHDEPYYGDKEALKAFVVRSKAKAGTTRFFRIISLYVIYRQMRLTVAVAFVRPGEKTVDIVQRLLQRDQALKLRIKALYLDRGYCSGEVITYLQTIKQPAVLACTIRGKTGGTRQLCKGRKSYLTHYTFTKGVTAKMAVVATFTSGKHKKRRRKWLLYVVIGLDWNPKNGSSPLWFPIWHRILLSHFASSTGQDLLSQSGSAFLFAGFCVTLGQHLGLSALVRCMYSRPRTPSCRSDSFPVPNVYFHAQASY